MHVRSDNFERANHHAFDHLENILLARERHLQIQLREFRLAVGAQVFVTEAAHDLEIAVHAGNHQDLLEDLRRLRQRVELAVMNAAGDQIVARAFGRRTRQHRSFDFEKAELVERLAHLEKNAVAQFDIAMRARPAQIEIAVAQARFFAGGHFVFNLEWRRFRIVQDVQARGHHFHFAGCNFWIRLLAADHLAFDGDHEFRAQALRLFCALRDAALY